MSLSRPSPATGAYTALVMDVDGVVSAVHPDRDTWGDEVTAGNLFGPIRVSTTLCRRLDAIAALPRVVPLWLTSWSPQSRGYLDPFPGKTWETLSEPTDNAATDPPSARNGLDWWKWTALRAWLDLHPEVISLVWCDDHLAQPLVAETAQDDQGSSTTPLTLQRLEFGQPDGVPYPETAAALIEALLSKDGITATLIAPETSVGLKPQDLDHLEIALIA